MPRFIEGQDRHQVTLLPQSLDEFIAEDNPADRRSRQADALIVIAAEALLIALAGIGLKILALSGAAATPVLLSQSDLPIGLPEYPATPSDRRYLDSLIA